MAYLGTKPANQVIDSTLIADGTVTTADIASGVTINFADGSASTPSITNDGDTNTGIFFPAADTIAFAEGGAEIARFNSSGNLGIGTASPQRKVSIVGVDGSTGLTEGNSRTSLFLDNAGANYLSIYTSTEANGGIFFSDNGTNNGGMVYETSADALYFIANGSQRVRIDSSGNVLFGTTSTNTGNGAVMFRQSGTGTYWVNATSTGGSWEHWSFRIGTTQVGAITTSGSNTSYVTSSDYRLKENIAPMTGALATVQALKPCTYTWKTDGSDGQGFIAHELAEVVPDAVTGQKDAVDEDGNPKYQGVDTSFLVATLTASIQELKAIVDAQAERIAALEQA
jgi:hypothetical protein